MSEVNFKQKVFAAVNQIPYGKVATYGQIAALAGSHRAARQVGWMLATLEPGTTVPWWRVVNRHGYLSIRNDDMNAKLAQASHLEAEGIAVDEEFLIENFRDYLYRPD